MAKPNKKGFTLIELLIAAVLIGILAGVTLVLNPAVLFGRGRDSRRKGDLRIIQGALEQYFSDNRKYPSVGTNLGGWVNVGVDAAFRNALTTGGYISAIPSDPSGVVATRLGPCSYPTEKRYNYWVNSTTLPTSYVLTSIMEIEASKDDSPCTNFSAYKNDTSYCGQTAETRFLCYAVSSPF